jgi:signal transduction histidine kinase
MTLPAEPLASPAAGPDTLPDSVDACVTAGAAGPRAMPAWHMPRPVLLFAAAALAAVCVAALASVLLLRDYATETHKRELSALSLLLAEDAQQKLFAAKLVLDVLHEHASRPRLAEEKAYREYLSSPAAFEVLRDKVAGNPIIDVATFVGQNGDVMNFTRSHPPPRINLADRDYFIAHAARAGTQTHYSVPVHNRGNGKWVFYMSRRVDAPDGTLLGLVLVGVSVEVFSDFYRKVGEGMGEGASISLYREDYTLMTRWPLRNELVGRRNPTSATARVIDRGVKSDVILAEQPRFTEGGDTRRRMVGPRKVERFPFIVTPVLTEELYLRKWRTYAWSIAAMALVCVLLVLLVALRMAATFRQREAALANSARLHAEAQENAARLRASEERQRRYAATVVTLNETLEKRVIERTNELRQANQELESYSYSVAHDLRTPLRMVVGFAQILRLRYGDRLDADFRRMQEDIARAGRNMGELIDGLLALARIGKTELNGTRTDLGLLARQVFDDVPAPAAGRRATFSCTDSVDAEVDPALMRAALGNLLSNAVKFSAQRPDPQVEFGTVERGGVTHYFVRDNGAGFDMSQAGKLFEPFQRLHAEQDYPGIGIGLATTRKIIERHGGRLWAEARPGGGATFYFTLGPGGPT